MNRRSHLLRHPKHFARWPPMVTRRPFQRAALAVALALLAVLSLVVGRARADAEIVEDSIVVTADGMSVTIEWETVSETDHAGFHIWRSTSAAVYGHEVGFLPAEGGASGTFYFWEDANIQPRFTYYYWIESTSNDGTSRFFGPFEITTGQLDSEPSPSPTASPSATATLTATATTTRTPTATGSPSAGTPTQTPTSLVAATATSSPPLPSATPTPGSAPPPRTPTTGSQTITPTATPPQPGLPSPSPGSGLGGPSSPTATVAIGPASPSTPAATTRAGRGEALPTVTPRAVATLVIALSQAQPAATPAGLAEPPPVLSPHSAVDTLLLLLTGGLIALGLLATGGAIWIALRRPFD